MKYNKVKSILMFCFLILNVSVQSFGSDNTFLLFNDDSVAYKDEKRDLNICLNCAGSKSQILRDFYSNIGSTITSCANDSLSITEVQGLFDNIEMIPVEQISPFNPMKLDSPDLTAKYKSLCNSSSTQTPPVAIALMNPETHEIKDIPMVLCSDRVLPLNKFMGTCQQSYSKIKTNLDQAKSRSENLKQLFTTSLNQATTDSKIDIFYQVVILSDYVEAHYLRCDEETSKYICKQLCGSETSCTIPVDGNLNAAAIVEFNKNKWKVCNEQKTNSDLKNLVNILLNKYSFAFSSLSLNQEYDLDNEEDTNTENDFKNFDILNRILSDFDGIFNSNTEWGEESYGTFLLSDSYRNKIKNQMSGLCADSQATPIVLGIDNKIHAVLCRSNIDKTSTLKIITTINESCSTKSKELGSLGI